MSSRLRRDGRFTVPGKAASSAREALSSAEVDGACCLDAERPRANLLSPIYFGEAWPEESRAMILRLTRISPDEAETRRARRGQRSGRQARAHRDPAIPRRKPRRGTRWSQHIWGRSYEFADHRRVRPGDDRTIDVDPRGDSARTRFRPPGPVPKCASGNRAKRDLYPAESVMRRPLVDGAMLRPQPSQRYCGRWGRRPRAVSAR